MLFRIDTDETKAVLFVALTCKWTLFIVIDYTDNGNSDLIDSLMQTTRHRTRDNRFELAGDSEVLIDHFTRDRTDKHMLKPAHATRKADERPLKAVLRLGVVYGAFASYFVLIEAG